MIEATDETVDATVASAGGSAGASAGAGPSLAPGSTFGRYIVVSRIGAGAMGVVLAAYDPELDRRVALKLLKPRGGRADAARARLQREAQALAKLNHTNVVGVHDVGVHDGRVYVAMEFVNGMTLTEWMTAKAQHRSWREVIGIFESAGLGLAAAHEQGLVHRDFKPDNVMIGDDRRVRVMDFGLARADSSDEGDVAIAPPGSLGDANNSGGSLTDALTRTGSLLGTPAYMAPEQFAGVTATERSDQFSFCVALFEALHGQRPFAGRTVAELALAVSEGTVETALRPGVPAWLQRIVRRGLSVDPAARFDSMRKLVECLRAGEARRRRHWGLAGALLLAAGVGAVWTGDRWRHAKKDAACQRAGATLATTAWASEVRDGVREALLATQVEYATRASEFSLSGLDAVAAAWGGARTRVCQLEGDGTWSAEEADKARWCLENQRTRFDAVVHELQRADVSTVQRAAMMVSALPLATACEDRAVMAGMPSLPSAAVRAVVPAAREALGTALTLELAWKLEPALASARVARAAAEKAQWAPLIADSMQREASILTKLNRTQEAEAVGADAYFLAARHGAWHVAASTAINLIYSVGYQARRPEEGLLWADHAQVAIRHAGDPQRRLEVRRANSLGGVHMVREDFAAARAEHERALEIERTTIGLDHPNAAISHANLGNALLRAGALDEARAEHEHAMEIREATLGPHHPQVGTSLNNLAVVVGQTGDHAAAVKLFERAVAVRIAGLGPNHTDVATTLGNLGLAYKEQGQLEKARDRFAQAAKIHAANPGSERRLAPVLGSLADVQRRLGDETGAEATTARIEALALP